ncbi:hypothetical protein [Pediococcus stilesii]|nr:hypothetical protein [Pediococcus stilesii]
MIIQLLMSIFAIIVVYIGYYLFKHRVVDFMMFKPSTTPLLSKSLNFIGKLLMGIGIIILLLGLTGNTFAILVGLILGIFSTTGTLLFLLKFL